MTLDETTNDLMRGVADALPAGALTERLADSQKTGVPLTVKLGCDPSRPDLHLGHAVVLRKLRQFQDAGHRAVLIVGDFTATIGDPSGKSKTRPPLTKDEARANGQSYFEQAALVLDTAPEKLTVVHNGDWLGAMTFADVVRLASNVTVARMLERDDFQNRYRGGEPISLHEFLYPLAQGQDSVHLDADVELGGTDQTFNLLMGRALQEAAGQTPQVCLTLPILEGTDGVQKMSKSLDNAVGLTEPANNMYGKLLSIPDALTARYAELASSIPTADLPTFTDYAARNPRDAKHDVALNIVALYHGQAAADEARAHFEQTVIRKDEPDDMPEVGLDGPTGIVDAVVRAGFAASNGEARRLVAQGGVHLAGETVADAHHVVDVTAEPLVLRVGKRRFARLIAA